jgi:hypothetical protein
LEVYFSVFSVKAAWTRRGKRLFYVKFLICQEKIVNLVIESFFIKHKNVRVFCFLLCYWMPKKAVIIITLVNESREKRNEELEKEIFDELSKYPSKIPWMKNVLRVEVAED